MLQVIKCLHLLWNFIEHLNDYDHDLVMERLPYDPKDDAFGKDVGENRECW